MAARSTPPAGRTGRIDGNGMDPAYELFDHTADIGVRVLAPSLAELLEPAARGLYAVIGRLVAAGAPQPRRFELTGEEAAVLLRDWLAELLRLLVLEQRMATGFAPEEFRDGRLAVTAEMCGIDQRRSEFEREAKAVTYHQLEIRPVPGGFEATFIVDI